MKRKLSFLCVGGTVAAIGFALIPTIAPGAEGPSASIMPPQNSENSANRFVDPASLKVEFIKEKSAKPYPRGTQKGSKGTQFAVMDTGDPTDVIRAKPIYFNQHTGKEVHYSVNSPVALSKLVYSGVAFKNFSIRIYDRGEVVAECGPFTYGNVQKTIEVPLPDLSRFEILIRNYDSDWLLIKEIRFVSGSSSAASARPATEFENRLSPAERIKEIKRLLECGEIKQEEHDRRIKEILDAI